MKKSLFNIFCCFWKKTRKTAHYAIMILLLTGIFITTYALNLTNFVPGLFRSTTKPSSNTISSKPAQAMQKVAQVPSNLAAGPILDVSTTLKSISCDKTATYEVTICNNGDAAAEGVTSKMILPENAGFVLKNIIPDPKYPITIASYSDPGNDTETEGYDGYMLPKAIPCNNLDYSPDCSPSTFSYIAVGKVFLSHAFFGFPVTNTGLGVPAGATILSARLNVQLLRAGGSVGGIKRSDLTIFNETNNPGHLYAAYPTDQTVPAILTEIDVTTVAQELVNQPDWTNNSMMAFFVNADGKITIVTTIPETISYLDVSYIAPTTLEPGECVTFTYEYDVSNADPGTYHMSTHVETTTAGTTFMPDSDFSVDAISNQNGYNGTSLSNSLDDTVIPNSFEPILNWTCPDDILSGKSINITATGSNIASTTLSSETFGTIVNTGTPAQPTATYTPTGQDIENKYATLKIETTSPEGCTKTISCVVNIGTELPVKLTRFDAIRKENSVQINWETSIETNSRNFEIERSKNGKIWTTLGSVPAHVSSVSLKKYQFTDSNPENGTAIYRLKMIDQDNTFTYSRMQEVLGESANNVSVYPNPVSDRLTITTPLHAISSIHWIDLRGNKILPTILVGNQIPVSTYPEGLYLLIITLQSGEIETQKIIIKH
jgi:hypothetical protein